MITILDLLFPRRCVGCSRIGKYICSICTKTISFLPQRCPECDRPAIDGLTHPHCLRSWGMDGLMSVCRYDGVVKKSIKLLKYRFVYDVAETLVKLVPQEIYSYLPKDTIVIPIPLHKDRLRWRGFNQAEKLGIIWEVQHRLTTENKWLQRTAKRTPQADISKREERLKNAHGIFQLVKKPVPAHILLFDDIWTTGATIKEATTVLKRAGAEKVWALTIAR